MMHEAKENSLNPALTVLQQQRQRVFSNIEVSCGRFDSWRPEELYGALCTEPVMLGTMPSV